MEILYNEDMSTLAGSSLLDEFLAFMAARARDRGAAPLATVDDLRHDLNALIALALAAYAELGELTREATLGNGDKAPQVDPSTVTAVREAHAKYLQACGPVLQWIEQARSSGVEPRRVDAFMSSVGEARLISERFDEVMLAERQADRGEVRTIQEVRNGVRRRTHPAGG
jgi:hypothetical protein